MSVGLLPFLACGVLIAAGVTLLLERSLVRELAGVILLGNGVNLLIVTAGSTAGRPPFTGTAGIADPLPQAMVLTAIVITLGMTAFVLALVHRSWQLSGSDEVQDDTEDRRVRLRSRRGELSATVTSRQDAYRRLLADQRAELAQLEAEQAERGRLQEADLERRIARVHAELEEWTERLRAQGLTEEELHHRLEQAGRRAEQAAMDNEERIEQLREEHARTRREQAARKRELRRKLKARQREARRQMRAAIREERERQALAQDPELEGED
ncbi:multicomponent Na+:H+ antiporter subunit C [Nonomuraea maritima]|uniref:Multicomponent Na+:H+ antiporter subunit C n=1 Tax=Nonomuraea maritima TaxID=683260 RepID=A0A1G8WQE0_9ACTN|nr:Na(+)/H(+) antiporter subunit C [Nonomuraea maritima]SDJ80609.1 multicomponent Na+:H+ antiporter subunit C [Nonomuraea maritima]